MNLLIYFLSSKALVICFGLGLVSLAKPLLSSSYFAQLKQPQNLPLEAQWCLPVGECLLLEVADEIKEKKLGLMYRKTLVSGTGMWFKFAPSRIVSFWMYETFIPLDMVFISKGLVIAIETNLQVCSASPCPIYGPIHEVDSVVELAAGEVERLKIGLGDPVDIQYMNTLITK